MRLFTITAVCLLAVSTAFAQLSDFLTTGNSFVKAEVLTISGQFHIMTADGRPLSYSGAGQWNSYTTFALNASGTDVYYTNEAQKQYTAGDENMAGSMSTFLAADATVKIGDTIRTTWNNMRNFTVVQDIYPVATTAGGQIMIKYAAHASGGSTVFKGIFLLIDLQVNIQPVTTAARLIMTSRSC